jgi:hypothetical protein
MWRLVQVLRLLDRGRYMIPERHQGDLHRNGHVELCPRTGPSTILTVIVVALASSPSTSAQNSNAQASRWSWDLWAQSQVAETPHPSFSP